jgi:hypothetical protein
MRITVWFLIIVAVTTFRASAATESVQPLGESWQVLTIVTGLHVILDKANSVYVRLIEANGEATVATNPVTLYLVVTNDSSAGDLKEHIWRLPVRVAGVRSVRQVRSGIVVSAVQDIKDNRTKQGEVVFTAIYGVRETSLDKTLRVEMR